ncbi:glycine cleavage system aminomethyltransferase GcvT [Actinomarinicola tropica]|uniref:aminomethyltransferase n=1 Tax=Actinomarinicola tropica TaxID=2789776 RepID=A0A5Q2RNP6_9ACTN|nr:glycine cleavage system aminomethyltransferase GcvT [Actinomarinicola tropica]QGG96211.1 glycine cleavage system aminomethyltransferase GcvT [Actinomarinicola tropica]
MGDPTPTELRRTPLHDLHLELGGRLVDFAGWALPVRYEPGPVAEHVRTRTAASMFDVSHMGIVDLRGGPFEARARALEALAPTNVAGLGDGRQRYTQLTNESGGTIDDLMVARVGGELGLVVNAARRVVDLAHLRAHLADDVEVVERSDLALLAVQGPAAVDAVAALADDAATVSDTAFMDVRDVVLSGVPCRISRSGYTGEDGVEIQVPADAAVDVARALLAGGVVQPAGLAARDSLRLEAGLCLYGHELDEQTTPVEAGLTWSIPRRRREEGGFLGADVVRQQLADGPPRRRIGLRAVGRQPIRDGATLHVDGAEVGVVTSGGFGPTVDGPVAMGYVAADVTADELVALVRGKELAARVVDLPFVPARYRRTAARPQERS